MDVVTEYLKNLKRLDDGERYFDSLSSQEYEKLEESREYKVWLKILENCQRLYPLAKEKGCNRIYYYRR
ncbi:hypothetical protein [Peptostreptococcus russellii]|uniref:hypothetical protein n=1 Tax=Peptostreptococcus russellii TaxID=215200 RepID=UPI003F58F7AA